MREKGKHGACEEYHFLICFKGDKVIDEFLRGFQEPKEYEAAYTKVMIANNPDELKEFMKALKVYDVKKGKK